VSAVASQSVPTAEMKRVACEQRLDFVATVNTDGTPNASPKATFIVLDDATICFGDKG
jgi:hypothetical protein